MPRNIIFIVLVLLGISSAPAISAASDPATAPVMAFLGEQPDNAVIKAKVLQDIRRAPPGELDALMEITLLCEVDRGALSRRKIFEPWLKRCAATEEKWVAKYRKTTAPRSIDEQMRLYFVHRLSLGHATTDYFAAIDAINLKRQQRKKMRGDVERAVKLRKDISFISTKMLKFFFALRDLADKASR